MNLGLLVAVVMGQTNLGNHSQRFSIDCVTICLGTWKHKSCHAADNAFKTIKNNQKQSKTIKNEG
jgi:hypothetical protein